MKKKIRENNKRKKKMKLIMKAEGIYKRREQRFQRRRATERER